MGIWQRISGPFKEFGIGPGAIYAADRVPRAVSPRLGLVVYEFIAQPVQPKPLLPASLSKNISFAEIGRDHPDLALMPARAEIKVSRFEQGRSVWAPIDTASCCAMSSCRRGGSN